MNRSKEQKVTRLFIVGLPRTGTKLVRNVFQASATVPCALMPESWYFGDYFRVGLVSHVQKAGGLQRNEDVDCFIERLYSPELNRSFAKGLQNGTLGIEQDELRRELLASDRAESGVYDALMRLVAEKRLDGLAHKQHVIVGDKMPGNLFYVDTLLRWYPDAKIVHAFRDPRAIFASEWKKFNERTKKSRFGAIRAYHMISALMYITVSWIQADHLHRRYERMYPSNYRVSKYEGIAQNPEPHLRALCEFVEVPFEPEMAEPVHKGSSFTSERIRGIQTSSIYRWKETLPSWVKLWFRIACGRRMKHWGY
ncbi:MAG: sulfotransferase [Pseudomonadota bacterium]